LQYRKVQRKLISTDPKRPAILASIRWLWKHLPADGLLLFFDVKPVAVKAYGGARYTSEKRLVLAKRQKTRGLFYLFALYEVNGGRLHWAFYPHKDSLCVCRFMQRVRRWYPQKKVWVVADQDGANPSRCKQTRGIMRHLGLHWRTLPKGSPDDNPVETIFSDVQQRILQLSNDPDAGATQRRISWHLRGRNRRRDRKIQILYLENSHKK
jgi:transposase